MARLSVVLIVAAMPVLITSFPVRSAPDKITYELQERCAKRATEFFQEIGFIDASFENHYNPNLNSCFIMITQEFHKDSKLSQVHLQIWNVNENRMIDFLGYTAPFAADTLTCIGGDFAKCPEPFAASVRQYMER